jgi:hypothetical protein
VTGDMNKGNRKHTEGEIDNIVTAEADDLSKWSRPIHVVPGRATALYLPPDTIKRAREVVKRKRLRSYQSWLREVIEDRIARERKRLRTRQTAKR